MEDHQELEKPIFELHHKKFRSSRKKRSRFGESMNRYEEIFCYYGLRESSKKTQKPPRTKRIKKRLIRCVECSKGFRYEKCLRNHSETMHSLKEKNGESVRRDLLRFLRSGVQRGKRSKRVSRYKKSPPPLSVSASSSSSFVNDGELLEVAETLIMLSKSGDALFPNLEMNKSECGNVFLSNGQKLVGNGSLSNGTSKELMGFLGDKNVMKEDETGQLKHSGEVSVREEVRVERVSLEDRPGAVFEAVFEVSNSGSKGLQMNTEHSCKLCDRVFSTYQALGGHQTFHRMKNGAEKPKHEMQRRVLRS